jgi:hypothetical protein
LFPRIFCFLPVFKELAIDLDEVFVVLQHLLAHKESFSILKQATIRYIAEQRTMSEDDDNSINTTSSSDDDETLSDQAHLHASFVSLDPSVLQRLQDELSGPKTVKEEETKEEVEKHEGQKEEEQMIQEAAATMQKVADILVDDGTPAEEEEKVPSASKPARQQQRRRTSLLKQSMIQTFSAQEERTVLKVLNQIGAMESKYQKEGFKELNFTAGVMNCFLVAYLFGAHPEHFWMIYLVESLYFIPLKYRNMIRAKPLNQALYYFDFCWMMNFNAIFSLLLLVAPLPLSASARRFLYRGGFGIACGPLLGATAILPFVGFVFHDLNTMTNVVIHAMPPMMFYTIRWHADEIRDAWPNVFQLQALHDPHFFPPDQGPFFLPGQGLGSIAGNAVLIYILWFIPYVSWMLLMGMDLPRKNLPQPPVYDTVFHSFWRVGACQTFGKIFWKRPENISKQQMETDHYEARDFLLYIGFHAVAALVSIPTLAFACNSSKQLHIFLLVLVLLICVHRGSQRYTYYTTKSYSRRIRKEFLPSKK